MVRFQKNWSAINEKNYTWLYNYLKTIYGEDLDEFEFIDKYKRQIRRSGRSMTTGANIFNFGSSYSLWTYSRVMMGLGGFLAVTTSSCTSYIETLVRIMWGIGFSTVETR